MANIIEKITGIFANQDNKSKETDNPNEPEQQKLYDMVYQDYQVFKAQRQTVEDTWRREQRFYDGDHWFGLRPPEVSQMRPNDVENVAWSQVESIVAKLVGWMPQPDFEAQEPNDEKKAEMLTEYIPYELSCIKFKQKHIRAVRRMVIHGPLVYKVVYDPTVEGGKGMNRYIGNNDIIPVDLGSFFPDPRLKDFIYLQKGSANIIHTVQSLDYFKERWKERGKLVQQDNMSADVEIFDRDNRRQSGFNGDTSSDPIIQQSERSGLIEYWYKGKPKIMTPDDKKLFKQLAEDNLAEGKDPSENEAKAKGTMNGIHCIYISTSGVFLEHKSYVYDHGQYPIVARTLFPDEDNPWGKGYMRDMMAPQIMLNKYSELGVEIMAKMGNPAIVYDETAITKPDVWKRKRSEPAAMLPANDMNGWKELQGAEIPSSAFSALEYYKDMLQKIPGQFDSANGQASSNVTSGEQAKALIAASSGRLALSAELIQDALEEVFMQYIELMAQFYTTERIVRVTGKQVSISRDNIVNMAPSEYEVTDPTTGEKVTRPVVEEYVPHFDIKVNIGVDKPKDREYMIQMAFNLFKMLDPSTGMPFIDAQAVEYTVENGRMEPFSVINDRMQAAQQQMQKMQELQTQIEQLTNENQVMHDMLVEAGQNADTSNIEALKHLNESDKIGMQQQQQAHSQEMDKARLGLDAQKIAQMGQRQPAGAR